MMDKPSFKPNFLVKRKLEVPSGDIDAIANVIAEFVPVWEIFRSSQEDYWTKWTLTNF